MRDRYGGITPDFDAWRALGWAWTEVHEQTYTLTRIADLDSPLCYDEITCEYDTNLTDSHKPEYFKERISFECMKLSFTPEELAQIEKDIKNWEEEMAAELDYQRHVEQAEHDELYEPTYDPDNGSM